MHTIKIATQDELSAIAEQVLDAADEKKVIAFYGEMGAGKTTLIKVICDKLGIKETVSSPTFSLVNEYYTATGEKVYHFDFYRINNISEVYDMGYEDYFYSGHYCLVEWPEKIKELLPDETFIVNISTKDGKREFSF
jgi:tRNA threonylcarbamoyladenosine biosynthesis protein TsaE